MKIAIFYEHAFTPIGAPVGIRNLARELSEEHEVLVWGKKTDLTFPQLEGARLGRYEDFIDMCCKVPSWIKEEKPDVLMVVSYFLYHNFPVVCAARRHQVPVVLYPLAQVWDTMFKGRVFTRGCDVRALESKRLNSDDIKQKLANRLSPYWKKLYKHSLGKLLVGYSKRIAVLSDVEQEQFNRFYPRPASDFIILPYGIDLEDATQGLDDPDHFYRTTLGYADDTPNLIVWARLDWYYKGLDRLLEGVRVVKERVGPSAVPFRLFLCGPDYRGGTVQIEDYVKTNGLGHLVQLLLPGSYTPGSKAALRDADASILLSPWDGSPRALREALYLGLPLLVSKETNFTKLIRDFNAGVALNDAEDAHEVADALLAMTDKAKLETWRSGAGQLSQFLRWPTVASRFAEEIRSTVFAGAGEEYEYDHTQDYALQG